MAVRYGDNPYAQQPVAPASSIDWLLAVDPNETMSFDIVVSHQSIGSETLTFVCEVPEVPEPPVVVEPETPDVPEAPEVDNGDNDAFDPEPGDSAPTGDTEAPTEEPEPVDTDTDDTDDEDALAAVEIVSDQPTDIDEVDETETAETETRTPATDDSGWSVSSIALGMLLSMVVAALFILFASRRKREEPAFA